MRNGILINQDTVEMKITFIYTKMSKRLVGKVKNVDDAEKNAMVWKKFLVKNFFILKMFEKMNK